MPAKVKTVFLCSHCDTQFPKWLGRCPGCQQWGTIAGQAAGPKPAAAASAPGQVVSFSDVGGDRLRKTPTGIAEFDRVIGGGICSGSLTLLGGEPGVGKSTLVLQVADRIADACGKPALYVSGEESAGQIKDRITRLGLNPAHFSYLGETSVETISATVADQHPPLAVVDSIQTIRSAARAAVAGSVGQITASAGSLMETAKATGTAIILVGHITKTGAVAGPKTLEHLVDTVVYLEGDATEGYRLLRTVKNRFGATNELGVFEMRNGGLQEVANPAAMFLAGRAALHPGAVVTPVIIGSRVFLAEIQALAAWTRFGYPQRKAVGYDQNRLNLIATVLDQRVNIRLAKSDLHLKVAGGLRVIDPAADLAVALAIASAQRKRAVDSQTCACGEVGLGGEVLPVPRLEQRVAEAKKIGFTTILVPKMQRPNFPLPPECLPVATVQDALRELWGG